MAYYGDNEVLFSPTVNTTVDLTLEIDKNSTNDECPSAKAVYDFGQFINSGSDPIVNIKAGEIVTMNDSGLKPLHGLNIYGKTPQNGTPTPDAPIDLVSVGDAGSFEVGVCGQVLVDFKNTTFRGTPIFSYKGNKIHYENTAGITCAADTKKIMLPKGTYTAYIKNVVGIDDMTIGVDGKYLTKSAQRQVFTLTEPKQVGFMITTKNMNTIGSFDCYCGIVAGNVPIEECPIFDEDLPDIQRLEVPYTLHGIPVESGGNYTDANGQQWICDEIDFENACVIQRIKKITFDENNINEVTRNEQPAGSGLYRFSMHPNANNPAVNFKFVAGAKTISTFLPFGTTPLGNNSVDNVITTYANGGLYFRCDSITSAEEFLQMARANNWAAYGVLAEPKLYSFQYSAGIGGMYCPLIDAYEALHTNKPNTTIISADNAGQRVAYVADPKLYIDNKFTELENAILSLGGNV